MPTDAGAVEKLLGIVRESRLGGTFLERMTAISGGLRHVIPVSRITAVVVDRKCHATPEPRHTLSMEIDAGVPGEDRHEIGCTLPLPRGLVLSFTLHRKPALGDFTGEESEVLALVSPDLGRAAEGALLEERLAGLKIPGEDKDTHAGLIVLDATADVVHADASALAAMQQVSMVEGLFADVLVAGVQALARPGPPWTIERSLPHRGGGWVQLSFSRVGSAGGVAALVRATAKESSGDIEGIAEQARLSPRELEVARLAVTGLANREIAARLGLSPITVKLHLSHVFKKTGVLGRTELAALLLGGRSRS